MEKIDEIIKTVQSFSSEEKTELVCEIIDDSCLDPHQIYPCLGLAESIVDKLANNNMDFFESEFFHRLQLDTIPTKVIREFVNKFNIENQ